MRTNKTVLNTAVGLALAALGTAAFAGQFTGPTVPSTPKATYATENFGPAAFIAADNILLPLLQNVVFTTSVGVSGGYVVNNGGQVYYYLRLNGATFLATPAAGDFSLALWPGVTWTIGTPVLSTDKTTVVVPLTNATGNTQAIGSGAQITWTGGAKTIVGTTAMRTAGDHVSVTASISGTTNNANVGTLPSDVDSAAAFTVVATAASLSGSVAANPSVLKIAVDETSQRKNFVGPTAINQLGSVTFSNLINTQLQVDDGVNDYTVIDPAGRLVDMTVTAGNGSFNAGGSNGVYVSTDAGCGSTLAVGTLTAGATVATFTGMSPATLPLYVCYAVDGVDQISEVTGISAAATLKAPPSINDADVATSGALASVVNDGTVIDARIYIPVAVNQFGYGMSLRVINTGSTAADIFAQYIYNDGTLSTQGKVATSVPVGGYVMLDNTQIEGVIGAPSAAKGSNPRVRVIAPTSSLRVQTFMRTNGIWAEVSGGQGESQALQVQGFGITISPNVSTPNDK